MLTAIQIANQRRLGYAVDPAFFSADEVALMRAELDRLVEVGEMRNVSTAGDGVTKTSTAMNLQICPLSPRSSVLRALPFAAKLVAQVQDIVGPELFLRLDQIFLKPARYGAGTNWHQDNAYFSDCADALFHHGLGIWIALHDATVANGTMHVVPASFDRTWKHERDPASDHLITTRVDESRAVAIEVPAGGVLFFNYGVPHCTKANATDAARAGLAIHVQDLALRTPQLAADGTPHPILAGPGADGGLSLYGEDQRGRWERLVEQHARSTVIHS